MSNESKNELNGEAEGQAATPAAGGPPKLRLNRESIRNLRVLAVEELAVVAGGYEVESKEGGVNC